MPRLRAAGSVRFAALSSLVLMAQNDMQKAALKGEAANCPVGDAVEEPSLVRSARGLGSIAVRQIKDHVSVASLESWTAHSTAAAARTSPIDS